MPNNNLGRWATRQTFGCESLHTKVSDGFRVTTDRLRTAVISVGKLNKTVTSITPLSVALATLAACSPSIPYERIPKATLTKQIFLEQHDESIVNAPAGNTRAIVPMPDGEVVLAGSILSAWASRIRADGSVAWRYVDPDSDPRSNQPKSEFTGAVGRSDGSVMLCGSHYSTNKAEQGLLLHIGSKGEVLSREFSSRGTGESSGLSSFDRCMLSSNAITLPDQTVVLAKTLMTPLGPPQNKTAFSIELKTMSPDGAVTNRRTFPCVGACGYVNLFQNVGKDGDFNLEVLDPPSDTLIYHLGEDLLDREAPVHSALILSRRSFRLPSGALLIFGEGSYQVVVTSIDRRGNSHPLFASEQVWDTQHRSISEESIKFDAVAAISGTEFVSVRSWVAPLQHRGVYVEWFKIE
jgi:hypothetical protein